MIAFNRWDNSAIQVSEELGSDRCLGDVFCAVVAGASCNDNEYTCRATIGVVEQRVGVHAI